MYYNADVYEKPLSDISFYTGTSGKYVSCTRRKQHSLFRLAMNIRLLVDNDTIAFAPKVMLIVADQLIPDKEMLGIVELQQAIAGLMENSCLFDFAYEVAERFFVQNTVGEYGDFNYFSVVGHSLGGAVAQYIGRRRDFQEAIRAKIRPDAIFGVYSFNSFGLSDTQDSHPHYRRIHSVQINGEILDYLNKKLGIGMDQVGNVLRYGQDLPASANVGERLNRHGIERVQNEICRCAAGSGTLAFE